MQGNRTGYQQCTDTSQRQKLRVYGGNQCLKIKRHIASSVEPYLLRKIFLYSEQLSMIYNGEATKAIAFIHQQCLHHQLDTVTRNPVRLSFIV